MPSGDLSRIKEKTMKLRVILVCTLLLLAATPSFAMPLCAHCDEWNSCDSAPGDFENCTYDVFGNCITNTKRCSVPSAQSTVLTDWKVASVEVSRPAQECATVSAPAEVSAPAAAPALRTAETK
jgi:hypothetical protein